MSLVPNRAIEGAGGNQGGYNIQRSLRFRSSASAYLDRTFTTPTNNKIYTWSGWIKKGIIGTANRKVLFSARNGTNEDYFCFDDTTDNLRFFVNSTNASTTSAVYRDASAWYHVMLVVDTTQSTAANRVSIYVNGTLAANANGTAPTQNSNTTMNGAYRHIHGRCDYNTAWYFDGYLAEVNFIDGQALTPSSFGQTDSITGVWIPKKYTGNYGTNGFYLNFEDNTSATTLAYDKSGNGNNWTPNNISTTAGVTYDSMTDVPTLTSATAANYATFNPLSKDSGVTLSNGNLNYSSSTNADDCFGTMSVSSGKWYFEFTATTLPTNVQVGVATNQNLVSDAFLNNSVSYRAIDGNKYVNGSASSYGATWTTNDVIGVAVDVDGNSITFYKNNTSQGAISYTMSGLDVVPFFRVGTSGGAGYINFGQRPFSYTPPTGFKALNTFNLPDPTIKKPNQYMDATTYTGTGSALSVTNAAGFQPDFVWVKGRSGATDHALYDAVRGVQKQLESNTTTAETTETTGLTAFNSNGFSVGALAQMNTNTATYVGWQWKKGATPGFDIVTYTGTGVARTVSHSLGVAPKMMIVKNRSGVYNWRVYSEPVGATKILYLNTTDASVTDTAWNDTAPTSSVFSLGANSGVNANGDNFVNYLFAEIAGFSKFGSYTGNGSADGPFVYCGFRPKWLLIKNAGQANSWFLMDTARGTYNVIGPYLYPDQSAAETSYNWVDIVSNGFKIRDTGTGNNNNGVTQIYAAFASNPFKFSNAA